MFLLQLDHLLHDRHFFSVIKCDIRQARYLLQLIKEDAQLERAKKKLQVSRIKSSKTDIKH